MINLEIINNFDNKIKLSSKFVKEIISDVIFNESKYTKISMSIIIVNDDYLRKYPIQELIIRQIMQKKGEKHNFENGEYFL